MNGKKTYTAAAAAALTAWALYLSGTADLADTLRATFEAILAACLRHGISTKA